MADGQGFVLSPKARQDLEDIWLFTAGRWSIEQAEVYIRDLNAKFVAVSLNPDVYRLRREFDPPVRMARHQSHSIIFTVDDQCIVILRIVHGRQDLEALLSE